MTDRKPGEMSLSELYDKTPDKWDDEVGERLNNYRYAEPGKHAALSRAQVRAFAPPLPEHEPNVPKLWSDGYHAGYAASREAFARALLALSEDAKSPLED